MHRAEYIFLIKNTFGWKPISLSVLLSVPFFQLLKVTRAFKSISLLQWDLDAQVYTKTLINPMKTLPESSAIFRLTITLKIFLPYEWQGCLPAFNLEIHELTHLFWEPQIERQLFSDTEFVCQILASVIPKLFGPKLCCGVSHNLIIRLLAQNR